MNLKEFLIEAESTDLTQIEKFLNGNSYNAWLKVGTMKVYVRKSHHQINNKLMKTFDIANVEQSEKQRGKGKFRQLIIDLTSLLKKQSNLECIFIENLMNDQLSDSLPSMGFKLVLNTNPKCFYMELK